MYTVTQPVQIVPLLLCGLLCSNVWGHNRGIYNYQGRRIATLLKRSSEKSTAEESVLIGDMNGDRIPDVTIASTETVTIYLNKNGQPEDIPLGTEFNFTLY